MRTRLLACGLLAVVLPVAAGCSSPDEVSSEAGRGWLGGPPPPPSATGGSGGASEDALAAAGPPAESSRAPDPAVPSTPLIGAPAPATGVTAGSVDDNERFDDYLAYRSSATKTGLHDVDVAGRRVVRVVAGDGHPVLGARVVVGAGGQGSQGSPLLDARTHSDGRVLFLPKATEGAGEGPWPVTVEAGGTRATATLAGPEVTVTLGAGASDPTKLDVVFLLDATGSMSDELDRLTANMASTASRVAATAGPGSQVRFGLTAFKDRGDDYVTRTFDLTGNVESFRSALSQVKAGGGGDKPESVAAGLHEAVTKPAWGGDDVAKVIVLVGDAAPHTDHPGEPSYAADARAAAARGIRLHAIASSGLDDLGEYAFRQMAQLTAGRFVFLTYGADGGPGASTPHHVDKYSVKSLDELVATLLTEELRPGRQTQ
jgi:hypothetical protein